MNRFLLSACGAAVVIGGVMLALGAAVCGLALIALFAEGVHAVYRQFGSVAAIATIIAPGLVLFCGGGFIGEKLSEERRT